MSVGARSRRTVAVYRFRSRWTPPDYLPAWGTREAITALDGCIPLTPTAREVDAALLDHEGFLPYGMSPDDVDG